LDESFTEQLSNVDPSTIAKDRLDAAKAILKRGDTKRSKRVVSFESRIRDTLTASHVYLLTWCVTVIAACENGWEEQELRGEHKSFAGVSSNANDDDSKARTRRSSLAFNFLTTIPEEKQKVKSIADKTMVGVGRELTVRMIQEMMVKHCPGKNVNESIQQFLGSEVVLLRKLQMKYGCVSDEGRVTKFKS
jgi:hypothetical protein